MISKNHIHFYKIYQQTRQYRQKCLQNWAESFTVVNAFCLMHHQSLETVSWWVILDIKIYLVANYKEVANIISC